MIATIASTLATIQHEPRLLPRLKTILLAASFLCGLAAPFASANCLGKVTQNHPLITMPEVAPRAESPDTVRPALSSPFSIVGLWNLSFYYKGQVVDVAFDAWHDDGTEVLNDYTDPVEGNVCLGVWTQTGPQTYTLTHPSWYFDKNGVLQGTVVIQETVTVSADGNSLNGTYTDNVYDLNGKVLETYSGKLKATRIKPA
jgi:hypothetical protein